MKVITKDFQRLKGENTFEFPIGITVIQGRSGSGKSSLFYAIEDCLSNPNGVSDVINWDADKCEVTVENDDHRVKWVKTQKSSEYIDKDGKPYVKASKLDSRDIDDLGFYFNKKDEIVNIHDEWAKLFPFESNETEMFKLFEDIFNISCSFQIIDSMKKDEQEQKSHINELTRSINELTMQNNSIDNILSKIDLNKLNEIIFDLQNKENKVNEIIQDYNIFCENQKYLNLKDTTSFTLNIDNNSYNQLLEDYKNYLCCLERRDMNIPERKELNIPENMYEQDYSLYVNILSQISGYDNEITKLNEEEILVRKKLKEIKVCPTCGHSLEE